MTNFLPGFDISLAFFATALLLSIAPGPDNIFVLTQSALFGARAGIITTLGLISGVCAHTAAVALGVAVIFRASPLAFNLLKIVGAGYLCWLAWQCFRAGPQQTGTAPFPGYPALYRRGIIMNVTNPKVCLFFLAFLPQFCSPGAPSPGLQIVWFGILFMIAALLVFCAIAILGGTLAKWFNNSPRSQIVMHRLTGGIFLCLALALALSEQ